MEREKKGDRMGKYGGERKRKKEEKKRKKKKKKKERVRFVAKYILYMDISVKYLVYT